jgi:hypothetical protein
MNTPWLGVESIQPVRQWRAGAGTSGTGQAAAKLMSVELFNSSINWSAYWDLMKQMSWLMCGLLITGYVVGNGFFMLSNLWIVHWCQTNATLGGTITTDSKSYQAGMYGLWIVLQCNMPIINFNTIVCLINFTCSYFHVYCHLCHILWYGYCR